MKKVLRILVVSLTIIIVITGCNVDLGEEVDDAKNAIDGSIDLETADLEELVDELGRIEVCGDMTLKEMMTANQIDEDCKEVLNRLTPDPETNIDGTVIAAGDVVVDGKRTLTLMGTDADGVAVSADGELNIEVSVGGTILTDAEFTVEAAIDVPSMMLSAGNVLDYSGSMSDSDIDDAIDVFGDLFLVTPAIFEHDYWIFSDAVERKTDFSSDSEVLAAAVTRDDEYPRSSTALFDAMGAAIEDLSTRDAMVKLLIVATDGGENSSQAYTDQSALLDFAKENNVHIIVMGTLVADLQFMKAAASKTDGFYFFAKTFTTLRDMIDGYIDAVENAVVVTLNDPNFADAADVVITIEDIPVTF